MLKELYTDSKGKLNPSKRQSLQTKQLIQSIVDSQQEFKTSSELLWSIINNCSIRPVCQVCGSSNVHLKNGIKDGFNKTCSVICAANNPERKEKIKQTELLRYGGPHTQNLEFKKKLKEKYPILPGSFNSQAHKDSIKKKYGVDNIFQSKEIKVKIKQINLEKYGVENPQQNKGIRLKTESTNLERYGNTQGWNFDKIKITNLKRFGVENPQQNKEIKLKTIATNIERYGQGGFNPIQTKATNLERYGVEYAIQNPIIFEKIQRSQVQARYKYKSFITPNGRTIWYQGYEKYIIEYLFDAGIIEADLLNDRYQVPVISYTFENKNRKYFPDIFIKSKNMLIEVKSSYTFDKEIQKNLAKQKAAKEAGYHHIIIIWSVKDNHIDQII